MKMYAIALDAGTPEIRNSITKYLSSNDLAIWHWVDDFWMVQLPEDSSPQLLHDQLEALPEVNSKTILVFEFESPIRYWGRNKEEAWEWLSHIGRAG